MQVRLSYTCHHSAHALALALGVAACSLRLAVAYRHLAVFLVPAGLHLPHYKKRDA